jgi:hypothetical protein
MAVGVIGEEKPRYFSIVRWGDAELTLAQVKRETVGREMAALIDCDRGDLVFSRCHVGCRGAWRIKVLPLHMQLDNFSVKAATMRSSIVDY